jgi:ATP-dependent Clp protease, protease subunit
MPERTTSRRSITVAATQRPSGPNPRQTFYVSFSAEINAHTTESLIAVMADSVTKKATEIHLLLSTPGGNVMNGINLYNVLRALPVKLVTHNVGNVDSIGTAVFLAGKERYACPHSTFMFHGVTAGFQQAAQLSAQADA